MDSKVSEKDMREVYFQAFGKEYDSADRKQAPLPLEIAYLMALNKLKREGKYARGGEITDDAYYQSVNHFVYFCMNYQNDFLDAFGSLKTHLSNKFKDYYNKYGTYGVMIHFYTELDSENRRILTDYSLKNYKGTPISSDISDIEYFNSVNHFIYFCFNFPSNFMDAFSSHLKVHLSSKWTNAYEKKGSVGAMIYFWSELDGENRRKLATWSKNNYTGTRLYEVGGALGDVAGMLPSPLPMSTIQAMADGGQLELFADGGGVNDSEYAKGGIIVTKIKDIPNFKERLDEGKITYRGLGMGKLFDDFHKISGTTGTRIKVDGKEYFITDEEFDTFSRDENGKLRVKFNAPNRKFSDGGEIIDLFEYYENIPANVQEVLDRYSNKFGEDFGEMDYDDMAEMQKDIEKLGYTFDSGLDNQPYGLRPIGVELNQLRGFEDFSKGGSTKVYKYGGEIEERVKEKLSRNFTLPFEVVVYVPSTQDADKTVSKEEFMGRITEVETYLAKLFGGFSANPVDGGYNSDEKGLITEDVFKVYSFASRDGFEPKMEKLVVQIKDWCKVWNQEAIGLEFEGDLFYVEA